MRLTPLLAATTAATALATTAGCAAHTPLPRAPRGGFDPPVTVTFEGAPPLRAEVARREDQRARGLMQRSAVPEGTGMVFLYPRRVSESYWMKGTLVPLSIAYVDGDRVVSTAEMTPCRRDPCPDYPAAGPYTMAVEARAGFFPDHGVRPGTRVSVTGATQPPQ